MRTSTGPSVVELAKAGLDLIPAGCVALSRAMKALFVLLGVAPVLLAAPAPPSFAKLDAVPFTQVEINDRFWAPRREINRTVSIPINLENLEKSGNLENLRLAARRATTGFQGPVFMDSDVYKALEAASYSLATHPDPALDQKLDEIIAILAAAQHPDGYLNSYYTVKEPGVRWVNLRDNHELYCAGHLFEAAVAHFQATGKRNFLTVATKFADCIDGVFGPPPKRMGYPGHPEIELALVKLARVTGEARYFELARFFVEHRGQRFFATEHRTPLERYHGDYWQDDVPITEHRNIKGHAVRAAYLMSGVTDVVRETGNSDLLRMLHRVWRNTVERNLYITGGIGPSAHNEGFTQDYDLPNATAYQETCATIALAQWGHRLACLHGDARFADVVERALYNGVLAGVSQDGERFFYVNPLESRGHHHRSPWFGCACCPPNVARTLASLGGYAYATGPDALYVNLYLQGVLKTQVSGHDVRLLVNTDYPWDGRVMFQWDLEPRQFALHLRLPGWCPQARVSVNGERVNTTEPVAGYLVLDRTWRAGDRVDLDLDLPVTRVVAHPSVEANRGRFALQRGPLVYCLEQVDNTEPLDSLCFGADDAVTAQAEDTLLGGVFALRGHARVVGELDWGRRLYQPMPPARAVPFKAVPYYAWDNRAAGLMRVWLPLTPPLPRVGGPEAQAAVKVSFAHSNSQPGGINDGVEPKSSSEQPAALCHWWPHKNTEEWVQYTWPQPRTFGSARVYWFDDTGRGACRLPAAWRIEYRDQDTWKPVAVEGTYPVALDQWCAVRFAPVTTTALRLMVQLRPDWAAGAHEWQVFEVED